MNLATSLGLYAAIPKEIHGNLMFPGSDAFYILFDHLFSPSCSAQSLGSSRAQVQQPSLQRCQRLYRVLAEHVAQAGQARPLSHPTQSVPSQRPRLRECDEASRKAADRLTWRRSLGNTRQCEVQQKIDLIKWSQREDVQKAWNELQAGHGLEKDAFEKAAWGYLGFVLGRNYNVVMSRAGKLGCTGYIDSWDALTECFDELEKEKILPSTN